MNVDILTKTVKFVKDNSKKRQFKQTFDLILNLKEIDLKKTENQVDVFANLHYSKGKKVKVCGLVGAELIEQAKKVFDNAILNDDFEKFAKDKKSQKKLADEYDFFVAQGNIMTKVASTFGRVFGPRGRMPNPKIGCVVPPNANLDPLNEKLHKLVRLKTGKTPILQVSVGNQEMDDKEIADNINAIYTTLIHNLPTEKNNIKSIVLKLTMSKPFKINDKGEIIAEEEVSEKEKPKGKEPKPAEEKKEEQPKEKKTE